jgi:hypothetical protein
MPFKHGKNTVVLFNARALTGLFNSSDFSLDVETSDSTVFGNTATTKTIGQYGGSFTFGGFHDPSVTTVRDSLGSDGGILTYAPGGAAAVGDLVRMALVGTSGYGTASAGSETVAHSWEVATQSAISFGQVLHSLSVDTNTTTGSSKDDTAATSTGWTAHLHVTAVSSGSWVVKLQDSADNSAWLDVTGATFSAATGATSQRLTGATATATLRRYVRYVATVTGGSTPTITFFLSYARS